MKSVLILKDSENITVLKRYLEAIFKPTKASEKGMNTYSVLSTDKKLFFHMIQKEN